MDERDPRVRAGIVVATLSAVAALTGSGSAQLVGAACMPVAAHFTLDAGEARAASVDRRDAEPIVVRNVFDSSGTRVVTNGGGEGTPHVEDGALQACASTILVGAYYAPAHPERSLAAIMDATGKSLVYHEGETIGGRVVESVGAESVLLRDATTVCSVTMFAPITPVAPMPDGAIAEGPVTRVSATEYSVPRSFLNEALGSPGTFAQLRVVPRDVGGRVGLRLYGVRAGSPLALVGLENGDTLVSIDGHALASVDDGMAAFAALRTADHASLSIVRAGREITIAYSIR